MYRTRVNGCAAPDYTSRTLERDIYSMKFFRRYTLKMHALDTTRSPDAVANGALSDVNFNFSSEKEYTGTRQCAPHFSWYSQILLM